MSLFHSLQTNQKVCMCVLFLSLSLICGCQDPGGSNNELSSIQESNNSGNLLVFFRDPFELSKSYKSQIAIFESIFLNPTKYKFSSSTKESSLHSFFNDLRNGHFIKTVDINHSYIRKEYHTFTHAMDVLLTTHTFLKSGAEVFLTESEQMALLLAAFGHDVLHAGVNNSFLIETNHPFSSETNGGSVQEKRSVAFIFELFDEYEIFSIQNGMSENEKIQISQARELVEKSILWTDIKKHKELISEVKNLKDKVLKILTKYKNVSHDRSRMGAYPSDIEEGINISDQLQFEERIILASFFLHCADVSNPGKEWVQSERWAGLVMNEFFSQGDLQKELGLKPSKNCDREVVSVPACQIGFGDYVIRDLYESLKNFLPQVGGTMLRNFNANQLKWKEFLEREKKTGKPYRIKFRPPTKEGGWIGNLRNNEN